jgi:hypothetical protein
MTALGQKRRFDPGRPLPLYPYDQTISEPVGYS